RLNADNGDDFLSELDQHWSAAKQKTFVADETTLPFRGGWFIYLGYELAGQIEPTLTLPEFEPSFPTAFATRIPAAVIRNHKTNQLFLIAETEQKSLISTMRDDVKRCATVQKLNTARQENLIDTLVEEDPQRYIDGIEKIKRYIIEGDIFQVNLSRVWRADFKKSPSAVELYQRLRETNPAPFAALITHEQGSIISSSPERLVEVIDNRVNTRPIAGTRPRGDSKSQDQELLKTLIEHPKERAEHVMLIDLERNDLGRICVPGTIHVDELMGLESYAHVHHIVSSVSGVKQKNTTPGEVIRALFPGGTITGCPKVRCMEIIAELEETGRGPYTGSVGYLNHNGDMDFNILIRTLFLQGKKLQLRAGGGIVADSDPNLELNESRAKARGLILALTE
ncbi:MAG TPA: aminodeoxychorismate synthase component I, partial [Gammaproteobacteria bacterium]|nr:aminodeoxychorismate synthase component I [Gammaproteobacteria bacterium]